MVRTLRLSPTVFWSAVGDPRVVAAAEAEVRAAAAAAGQVVEEIPGPPPGVTALPEEW